MTLRWNDNTTTTSFPAYKQVTPGTYSAQCCNGSNCSAMTPVTICTLNPNIQQINTNKDDPMTGIAYAAPNEPVLLTATGCDYGTVQWMYSGQTQWGNPVTVYGPGKYYARCFVTDHSTSPMISREIYPRTPGSVSIIPSQYTAYQGQMLTLTATGCNGGQVHWTYTEGGQTYNLSGRSIDVVGPNTYYAKCIVYGDTGPQSSITIPQASGIPKIITDKSRVRPNETFTFQVDFSSCPSYGWPGGSTLVTQEGVTTTLWGWDPITLTGPAVLEARCENASWAKQTKEVFFAPGDNMRLVANKSKAKHNESVLLTTYGCDFGYVEWKIGNNMILGHELDPKRQITQTGPGFYKARCKNDFMVNSDWVTAYVDLDGSIVPVINGPNSLCPNTAATLTTPGCPSGYYNSWSTLEQGGYSYGGNSVTVYLPQTIKLRCLKNDNSWGSDEKPFTIASAIPDDIKVTSNSPVVSGGTALLTGTTITGATYLWTPPAGVTLPVLNNRILQIPNVTPAYSGEYKLKVSSGGCEVEVSSRLDVDLCNNLYVKAFDPANGEEKTRLTRKPGQLNLYDDLVLQVEAFDGEILKGVVEYTWTMPQGVTAGQDPAQKHKITINKIGNYKVNVTSAGGVSCPLEVDISALACATPADFLTCGSSSTVTSTGTEKLKNLAVGDVFSTYDYVVSVTEVSGSESSGWTGRGFIEMSFLKLGATALSVPLAVRFDNIHLNQCYQLLPGSKVTTEFDENWSNVSTLGNSDNGTSNLINELLDTQKQIQERVDVFTGSPADTQFMNARLQELNDLKTQINNSNIDPEVKSTLLEQVDALIGYTSCSADVNNSQGARVAAYQSACSLNPWVALAKCLGAASLDIFGSYAFKWLELNVTGSSSVGFTNFSGVTSQMDWTGTLQSAAVSCFFSVIPIPSGKTALAAMTGAAGLSAAEAFSANVISQYNSIRNNHSTPSDALRNINWQQAVSSAAGSGMITFVSTALMRASSHGAVQALKSKIIKYAENNGGAVLRTKLKSLGFADLDVDQMFKSWGISEIKALPKLAFDKPFSKSNYRQNLMILTGKSSMPSTTHAHHVFSQSIEFSDKWAKAKIDIYDPRFLQWWDSPDHQKKDRFYRAEWREFFEDNKNPTQAEIFRKGKEIMSSFGFTVNY